jgi:hypothetical protein
MILFDAVLPIVAAAMFLFGYRSRRSDGHRTAIGALILFVGAVILGLWIQGFLEGYYRGSFLTNRSIQ